MEARRFPNVVRIALSDLRRAVALLSRIPCPADFSQRSAQSAWAYGPVGLFIAGPSLIVALTLTGLGFPLGISCAAYLTCSLILTGAIHADGLADCTDGFWGGWTKERRLEIMKDSAIGCYGVLALIFYFGALGFTLAELLISMPHALIAAAIASRASMVLVMYALPHARDFGLSHTTGKPVFGQTAFNFALLSACTLPFGLIPWVMTLLTVVVIGRISRAKIGGQTGDVLGATQMLTELIFLMSLLPHLSS